uniref:Uncharacterized protein n=1 Tax=Rhizophora mucronata TaxID=61149 RepID=A0A2P2QB75_RHIMU
MIKKEILLQHSSNHRLHAKMEPAESFICLQTITESIWNGILTKNVS